MASTRRDSARQALRELAGQIRNTRGQREGDAEVLAVSTVREIDHAACATLVGPCEDMRDEMRASLGP